MKKLFTLLTLFVSVFALISFCNVNAEEVTLEGANADVLDLFEEYYNEGIYTKHTKIYVDVEKDGIKNEITTVFHGNTPKVPHLTRTTYYSEGRLWMEESNSGYKTNGTNMDHFRVEGGNDKVDYTVSGKTLDEYYISLDDFVNNATTAIEFNEEEKLLEMWEVENGIYYTKNASVLEAYRLFTAPLWLGKTSQTANYITYDLATVEVKDGDLVTSLLVLTDQSKLKEDAPTLSIGEKTYYTFSQAVIRPGDDRTKYKLFNGGFENGLEGWSKVGNIGDVSADRNYWLNDPENAAGYEFGMDGKKMFSAYAPGSEERAVGTLTSSSFIVGGSGFVTFKLGAMRDGNYVYVDVVDASTKQILARYYNGLWAERTDNVKSGCTLISYKADLSDFLGKEVFFRISDNADSGYGLFFVDSFETYYQNEPEGFNVATPVNYEVSGTIYDLFNGGFEMGDNQGWLNVGEPGRVTGADAFFSGVAYGKNGKFLYSGVEDHMAGNGREGNMGTLTSSVFEIGGSGYITYMLGGGNTLCYVQVIDSTTGETLGRYRQQAREDAVLKTYVADLSAYIGRTVRIQVVDKATHDWGCISFDNVVSYYTTKPEGIVAIDVKNEIANGSFENGLDGWSMHITEAGAHNTLGWVESAEHNADWYTKNDGRKDGNNLFTFCRPDGTNCENTKGTLNSSVFTLKKDSYVTFRFGGAGTRDVRVELVREDGSVIATFFNEASGKRNTEMFAYYYQYTGETADCYFRVVDDSVSNYGCFVVDDFRVNLDNAPEGFIAAIQ